MTIHDVLAIIEQHCDSAGSLRSLAKQWGVSAAYLSDIRRGHRKPGPSVLVHLGLKAETTYSTCYVEAALRKRIR